MSANHQRAIQRGVERGVQRARQRIGQGRQGVGCLVVCGGGGLCCVAHIGQSDAVCHQDMIGLISYDVKMRFFNTIYSKFTIY
jgi:hypothetical protein